MKRILLLCAAGITTSLLTKKLDELVKEKNDQYEVVACPIAEVATLGQSAQMMLLSPQVRFNYGKIQQMFPNKLVIKIESDEYTSLEASKILRKIENNLE